MKVKKWYFAAQFGRLAEVAALATKARTTGLEVTSRWLEQDPLSRYAGGSDEAGSRFAVRDLDDIRDAQGFLFFAEDPTVLTPRGGRHVEFGYAIALGKCTDVVGPKENVFHLLHQVKHYSTFEEWLKEAR